MKKRTSLIFSAILTLGMLANTGCTIPAALGLVSATSFGAGWWLGSRNTQTQTITEYYIDGVKVDNPAALGLE